MYVDRHRIFRKIAQSSVYSMLFKSKKPPVLKSRNFHDQVLEKQLFAFLLIRDLTVHVRQIIFPTIYTRVFSFDFFLYAAFPIQFSTSLTDQLHILSFGNPANALDEDRTEAVSRSSENLSRRTSITSGLLWINEHLNYI